MALVKRTPIKIIPHFMRLHERKDWVLELCRNCEEETRQALSLTNG